MSRSWSSYLPTTKGISNSASSMYKSSVSSISSASSASNASMKGYNSKRTTFKYTKYKINNNGNSNNNRNSNNNTNLLKPNGFNAEFKSSMGSYGNTVKRNDLSLALGNIKNNYTKSLVIIKNIITKLNDSDKKQKYFDTVSKDLQLKKEQLAKNQLKNEVKKKYENQVNTMLSILYDTSVLILQNNDEIKAYIKQLNELADKNPKNCVNFLKLVNKNIKAESTKFSEFFEAQGYRNNTTSVGTTNPKNNSTTNVKFNEITEVNPKPITEIQSEDNPDSSPQGNANVIQSKNNAASSAQVNTTEHNAASSSKGPATTNPGEGQSGGNKKTKTKSSVKKTKAKKDKKTKKVKKSKSTVKKTK